MLFLAIIILIVFSFVVNSLGVSRVVFGGDSADIVLSYYFAGVAHPPGYPLNTMLGWLITRILIGATFAYKANLVSAIYHSISIGLLFFLLTRLTKNYFISLIAALILLFTPLFWLYSHVAEVFQLSSVLVMLYLIFLFEWWKSADKKKPVFKWFLISTFFLGLASFHHQTVLLLMPGFLYVFYKTRKFILGRSHFRKIFSIIIAFTAGILPYIFVFWSANQQTPINWGNPVNFSNFLRLITRADYGSFTASQSLVGLSAKMRLIQLIWYFKVLKADLAIVGIILILIGFAYLYVRQKNWFWFFVFCAFFTGPFFLVYASYPPTHPFLKATIERFLLLHYIFIAILIAFALKFIYHLLANILAVFINKKWLAKLLIGLIFIFYPFNLILNNWHKTDLANYSLGAVLAKDVLESADPPGIILLQGDTLTFNSEYAYYVDEINNSSKIILIGRLKRPTYRERLMRQYPELKYPNFYISDKILDLKLAQDGLIEQNLDNMPIYVVDPIPLPNNLVLIQQGMLKRLYKADNTPSGAELLELIQSKVNAITYSPKITKGQYSHLHADSIEKSYAAIYTSNGTELLKNGFAEESQIYFQKALDIQNDNTLALLRLGYSFMDLDKCQDSKNIINKIIKINNQYWLAYAALGDYFKRCLNDSEKAQEQYEKAYNIKNRDNIIDFRDF